MVQSRTGVTRWLTLSEAAGRLNVHPTTFRRWADDGRIPVMLTPGGHRRFAESDIARLARRRRTIKGLGPVERIWAREALEHARRAVGAQRGEAWLIQHDAEAKERNRQLGRQLMNITLHYLLAEADRDASVKEAGEIGRRYGENARRIQLRLTDALRVSMFFRDTLVTTAVRLPENVRIPPDTQLQLVTRINEMLNAVLLGVAEAYETPPAR